MNDISEIELALKPKAPDRKKSSHPAARPQAVLFVNDLAFAGVCAWCADKAEADAWCQARGYAPTHSICPTCRTRLQEDFDGRRWVA